MRYKHYLSDIVPRGERYVCRADENSGVELDARDNARVYIMSDRKRVGNSYAGPVEVA